MRGFRTEFSSNNELAVGLGEALFSLDCPWMLEEQRVGLIRGKREYHAEEVVPFFFEPGEMFRS